MIARLSTCLALAAGLGLLAAGPASADSVRTDCMGNNCVRVHCYDNGTCTRSTNFAGSERDVYRRETYSTTSYAPPAPPRKPARYACNTEGVNCHWTRTYFYNEDGDPVFDPGASPY